MPATPDLSLRGANGPEAISIQILTTIPQHLPRDVCIKKIQSFPTAMLNAVETKIFLSNHSRTVMCGDNFCITLNKAIYSSSLSTKPFHLFALNGFICFSASFNCSVSCLFSIVFFSSLHLLYKSTHG